MNALFAPDPEFDVLSTAELLSIVDDRRHGVGARGRALVAAAKHADAIDDILAQVEQLRGDRILGAVSLAHLGIGGLLASGNEDAKRAAREAIEAWEQPDKNDLVWLLKSANLL